MKNAKKVKTHEEEVKNELRQSILGVIQSLKTARLVFDNTPDEEILESCMYEIKYLQSKYAHLLKEAHTLGLEDLRILRDAGKRQA